MIFAQPSPEAVKMVSVKTQADPFPLRKFLFILGEIILALVVAHAVYGFKGGVVDYIFILVAAVLLFSWWSIGALVFSAVAIFVLTLVVSAIVIFPFITRIALSELWLFGILFLAILFIGAMRAKNQADNSINFSALGGFAGSRGSVLFCLSLVIAMLIASPFLSYDNARFSAQITDLLFKPSQTILARFYPGFSMEMTVDELFSLLLKQQIKDNDISGSLDLTNIVPQGINLGSLSQSLDSYTSQIFKKVENEARAGFLEKLSSIAGFTLKGSETVKDVFVRYFEGQYSKYSPAAKTWIGRGIFVVLLLGISGIAHMFGFVLSFVELVLFGILRSVQLLRISRVSVEKEILSLN